MSIRRYIYAALLLLSAMIMTGCAKEVQPEVLEGTGTVNITVSAPVETKSPLAADQDKMIKTLSVWLVNGTTGKVEDISLNTIIPMIIIRPMSILAEIKVKQKSI